MVQSGLLPSRTLCLPGHYRKALPRVGSGNCFLEVSEDSGAVGAMGSILCIQSTMLLCSCWGTGSQDGGRVSGVSRSPVAFVWSEGCS